MILFRDYGLGDTAQERFSAKSGEKKLEENFFVRHDGTRAYYFSTGMYTITHYQTHTSSNDFDVQNAWVM